MKIPQFLRSLFGTTRSQPAAKPAPAKATPPTPAVLTDDELQRALKIFAYAIHNLRMLAGSEWYEIPAVHCPVPFGGWGFVEGCTRGWKVNKRLTVVEQGDDMEYTKVCVLLDGTPCLSIKSGWGLTVDIISLHHGLIQHTGFADARMCMDTVVAFRGLPDPVQRILHDILASALRKDEARPDPIEKMLEY